MFKHNTLVVTLILTATLAVVPASAQVNVDCNNGDSLQAAISSMTPSGVNVINVVGTCHESVSILGFQDLLIKGSGGTTIHPPLTSSESPAPMAMSVSWGSNVRLCGLTLEGALTGLGIFSSQVQAGNFCGSGSNTLIVRDSETGIAVTEGGMFLSNSSGLIVENNSVRGVYANASRFHLQGYLAADGSSTTKIRNNGTSADAPDRIRGGIYAGEGATVFLYNVDVVDNQGWGISGVMGSVVHLYGSNVARNSGWGLLLSNNSTGQILVNDAPGAPARSIAGNGGGGVLVTQRSALRVLNAPVISGNTGGNLVCTVSGEAYGTATNIPGIKKDCRTFTTVADD